MFGYALDSGQGNDPIRVAIHHDDKPSSIPTEPFQKYELQQSDAGFISMERPPVIKAGKLEYNFPADIPNFGEMKRDISKPRLRPP